MWIKTSVLLCCFLAASLAVDEHRPKKSKDEVRGKRNLQYSISHHYAGPQSYRLERRISTGPQIPQLYHSPFFPGPRSYSPFHKGRPPHSLPPPPYAVQMEPLVQYSQRDPLYDTNVLSLNTDGHAEDLLSDNNHLSESVYGTQPQPHKQIIERPVYIKEPEPIIEIIIKESNVTLPPPPTPPAPPPKKKEQVQVFYVKYKKNPNGHGKDSIIYDKPVPAISPPIKDQYDEEPPQEYHHHHHQELATGPPPPSTTLRTIIHPDSETYHSPSGVKVTFGKEGFDYEKRSNKQEDLNAASGDNRSVQFPQGRQLSSNFPPPNFQRRPQNYNFKPVPTFRSEPQREPQPYRPFNQHPPPQFRQNHNFPRQNPAPQQYSTLPKFVQFPQQPKPQTPQFAPQRPNPPQFNQPQRQPVPYQPFESLRQPQPQQQQFNFRPQTHFPVNQPPQNFNKFNSQPDFPPNQPPQNFNKFNPQPDFPPNKPPQNFNKFNPQPDFPPNQHSHLNQPPQTLNKFNQQPAQPNSDFNQPPQTLNKFNPQPTQPNPEFLRQQQIKQQEEFFRQQQIKQQEEQRQKQHYQLQQQQLLQRPIQHQHQQQQQFDQPQNVVPPGGELIPALPKFEQHISVLEPNNNRQQPQALPLHQQQQQFNQNQNQVQHQPRFESNQQTPPPNHLSQEEYNNKVQQQFREANALQESIRSSSPQQYFNLQQSQNSFYQSTPRSTTASPSTTPQTTTTTTQEPEKPSTTTKDPTVLNAQLPDEVPDDLREQLLSSGILNNADISILDYDKVGDIPLSALPPDQLANFYNAGGAQQIAAAGSEPIPSVLTKDGSPVDNYEAEAEASEQHEVRAKPEVQMKVVHYDPQTERGQRVQESYVKEDATQVDPVVLNDEQYNRYLPLKVSGAQFPIPDVPELKGKKISSVVVLAPVSYDFSTKRQTREAKSDDSELIQEPELKELLKNPTLENYKKFFEKENKTRSDKQAVILLVTGPTEDNKEKEIYMYDIATKSVSKLSGELSAAFVEAAEANASDEPEESQAAASNIIETRVPFNKNLNLVSSDEELESASNVGDSNVKIIDPMDGDLETEASEHLESFVDISGMPVDDDLTAAASDNRLTGLPSS